MTGSEHRLLCFWGVNIVKRALQRLKSDHLREGEQVEKDRKKLFVCLVILPFSSRRLFGTIAMLESSPSPKWVAAPKLSLLPEKSAPTQRSKEGGKGELTRARNHFCSHLQGRGEEDGSCGKLGEAALEFCLNEHSACSSGQILPDHLVVGTMFTS